MKTLSNHLNESLQIVNEASESKITTLQTTRQKEKSSNGVAFNYSFSTEYSSGINFKLNEKDSRDFNTKFDKLVDEMKKLFKTFENKSTL